MKAGCVPSPSRQGFSRGREAHGGDEGGRRRLRRTAPLVSTVAPPAEAERPRGKACLRGASAGFTLIEILVVIAIIGILMFFLVTQFMPFLRRGEEYKTTAILNQLRTSIDLYENAQGDFPPSDFHGLGGGSAVNNVNSGAESLAVALFSPSFPDKRPDQKWLQNTDGDRSEKQLTDLDSKDLFEICDAWGNPIAYFHNRDYGKAQSYRVSDSKTGDWSDLEVTAQRNAKQGNSYYNAQEYQLISAGADGQFGTEDDVTNFK